jgi:hypothetical protein
MSWVRHPFLRLSATLLAGVLALLAITWVIRASGYRLSATGLVALVLAWTAVIGVMVMRYWRGIDEAAREAQKWAWFWGGVLGLGVSAVALKLNPFGLVDLVVPVGAGRQALLAYGAGIVVVGQLIGFHLAWAYWWWSRR